ncbi:coiled-coil domain-containing protein 30 isoform X2 [Parambassis ranga]|uniref:Coiled-coil domain-containing protein 30 isoform X2 n=1 Tax=Parambassis ranga TaxID=210632 RepID=A0A6P7I8K6_9TELE|nr:coiled-coil domain-containing protein 30-like isoform X2 [Parambassis ranga]
MEQAEELEQIATWFRQEGLAPDSTKEAQLCLLWRALQHTRSRLSNVTRDLEIHRSKHLAEMAEVRKSLEQIRIFTEHKDVLAQEIQNENDQLQVQLHRLVSLQDAQISEVAKMLYQQGLTELIHSSPSEQVAYLLVERASLLETSVDPDNLTADGNTASLLGAEAQRMNTNTHQCTHKGAACHGQSAWKKLFGLHKALQSKHTFIPAEARHSACRSGSLEKECSRLERDLEEGSRRLAMAHNEIRRLTDELESAHLTQRAYEMVELRKAKELNDRLDLEIRALRNRVRCLDAEKSSLQQSVVSLQEEVEELDSALQEQQQQVQAKQTREGAQGGSLQEKVEQLESALKEQQQHLLSVQLQANEANDFAKAQTAELVQSQQTSRNLQENLDAQTRCLLEKEDIIESLQQQLEHSQDNNRTEICTKENNLQDDTLWKQTKADLQLCEVTQSQLEDSSITEDKELQTQLTHKECPNGPEEMTTTQDECEVLKMEICETLKCLDKERSKYHVMKEKQKAKLCRAKQKLDDETTWRDEKIQNLERELSLSSHSLAKKKELIMSIGVENEKLLFEKRKLLQQLSETDSNKKDSHLTASLSQCRVDFLEMENKKLGNKIFHMSNQLAVLQRRLQNMQSLHFAQKLNKMVNHQQISTSLPLQMSSVPSEIQGLLDSTQSGATKQTDASSFHHCYTSGSLSRSAEMGYLNLTSTQSQANH